VALELWSKLPERWGGAWSEVRDVRPHQPVMAISSAPTIPADRRVRRVTLDQWDAYTDAAVKMYTEEIGVSPVQGNPSGYRFYVRQLIASGRAFGIFEGNRVLFKADLGSVSDLSVKYKESGWNPNCVVRDWLRLRWPPSSSWRVRSFPPFRYMSTTTTWPARATYAKVGFTEVGEFATVHF
jgi:predicted GNAT family acetyltransferase